ncbi:universal stress protein [Flavivirga sp. 57AJ16]|uniref:universal stress protein n=1 Tax=Flavivirga sp. 57AJ16 TaxID=3025307 RepID=UPI0023670EAF|nr:universal stress protein [Flavivirga sp. 57AJ16]MDD7886773.1 universal stress protein [Flavivirga sp. 57AJ16]
MKKILIPTDFSLNSYQTVDYITTLFKNVNCEFYFLNTYKYETSGLNAIEMLQADDEWFEKPKKESLKKLGILVTRKTLKSDNPKHTFHAISESRSLAEGIKENVDKIGIDVVVLTSKGLTSLGATTENILEKIRSCPILIVPPHAKAYNGIHLIIASDFQEKINTEEIERFIKVLENTKTKIGIFVLEEQSMLSGKATDNLEIMLGYLKQLSNKPIDLEFLRPDHKLADYAASHNDKIICVVDKKPDLFRRMGIVQSKVISTLKKLNTNTVLTVHQ